MNKFENGFNEAESTSIDRQSIVEALENEGPKRDTMIKAINVWMQNQAV